MSVRNWLLIVVSSALLVALIVWTQDQGTREAYRLRIIDEAGHPVFGAMAFVAVNGVRWNITTDRQGWIELDGDLINVQLDIYVLPPNGSGCAPYSAFRVFAAGERLVISHAFSVTGSVRSPDGQPLPFATLERQGSSGVAWTIDLDDAGHFTLADLPRGDVILHAFLSGPSCARARTTTVTVAAGSRNVVLTLDPEPTLDVRVANWPGGAAEVACELMVQEVGPGADGNVVPSGVTRGFFNADGRVQFHALSRHTRYRVFAHLARQGLYLLENGMRAQSCEVVMLRGHTISGVVRRLPQILGRMQAWAFSPQLQVQLAVQVEADGAFRVTGVPPGPWVIRIEVRGGTRAYFGETRVSTVPAANVRVDLE